MAQDTESIAVRKAKRSSSSSSRGSKGARKRISKKPRNTGRITKKEYPAAVPYKNYLYPALKKDLDRSLGYLTDCFNDEFEGTFLVALRDVVLAYGGVAKIAKAAGLNRESLYKVLSKGGNPEVNTLRKILGALKMKIEFVKA